jgi:protein-disulfide isomerase
VDDPSLTDRADRRQGLGRSASLILVGALAGLAIGWLAWRESAGSNAGSDAADAVAAGIELADGIDVSRDPVLGPADAPITIIEFSDFECPFCSRFAQETAPALRRQYGERIRWIFVNYPLRSIHPNAYEAALAGECAAEQDRFWPFYDAMFSGRHSLSGSGYAEVAKAIGLDEDQFRTCLRNADHADEVALDMKEGEKFYILGTPTFYVNGKRMEGAQRPEAFAAVIDSILTN